MSSDPTIHEAALSGDMRVLQKWADTEGDLERKDTHDFTALHWGAKGGKEEVVNFLLEKGASVHAVNCAGDRPLHYAVSEGHLSVVKMLVDKGADVNSGNDHGNTPMHYACYWRRSEIAEYLLEKGALVSASNKFGKTPLHRAGDSLAAALKQRAVDLGQNLQVIQVEVRSSEEAAALARAKFLAESGLEWHVKHGTISYEELLSSPSAYFEVFRGEWSNYTVAIKKPLNQDVFVPEELKQFEMEVTALRKLYHPNIHPILGGCLATPNVCLFTELMPVGSLYQLLHDPEFNMDQRLALKFAIEVAKGLAYLHEQGVAHRNLKSSNALVTEDLTVKLTDYGMVHVMNSSTDRERLYEPQYIAPEALKEKDFDDFRPCDIYSFGVVFFEIVTRQIPFEGMTPTQIGTKIVLEGMKPEIPAFVPRHLSQLMALCWQDERSKRPKISQIVPILEKC